ncbi:MAG: rhamnogalacturonan acetylesterase [Lachnospiraceae bacterium]|nr:rhamnogalacturonan acetylesterase [Lachnospiraceae bacterium]
MPTVYYAGDSTVQTNDIATYPQTGMGQVLGLYLRADVPVSNHGKNGRSTKSYIAEQRLSPIGERITAGDFLLIQFGHNDEKEADRSRYAAPFGEYQANLEHIANVALERGAYPVLITPLERRRFAPDGTPGDPTHGEYPEAVQQLGERLGIPVIDLNGESRKAIREAGPEGSKEWFLHLPAGKYAAFPDGKEDDTHLSYAGAVRFADIIARGLERLGSPYDRILCPRVKEEEVFVSGVM